MADLVCVKCGSSHVVPDARVLSRGVNSAPVSAVVDRTPDAMLFKGEEVADIRARVCADCGHVEMFVRGAMALYRAHKESSTNSD